MASSCKMMIMMPRCSTRESKMFYTSVGFGPPEDDLTTNTLSFYQLPTTARPCRLGCPELDT